MKFLLIRSRTAIVFLILAIVFLPIAARAEKNPLAKPIDLNVANAKELQELPGVGLVMAQRIIDIGAKSGHFHRVEDLLAIRGISQNKLDAMRPYLAISAPAPSAVPPQKNTAPAKKGGPLGA